MSLHPIDISPQNGMSANGLGDVVERPMVESSVPVHEPSPVDAEGRGGKDRAIEDREVLPRNSCPKPPTRLPSRRR